MAALNPLSAPWNLHTAQDRPALYSAFSPESQVQTLQGSPTGHVAGPYDVRVRQPEAHRCLSWDQFRQAGHYLGTRTTC